MTYDVAVDDAYVIEPLTGAVPRSNRAVRIVHAATGIVAEDAALDRADVLVHFKRVREMAALAGKAERAKDRANNRAERYRLAVIGAKACEAAERLAAQVQESDARFADIDPDSVYTEPGMEAAEEKVIATEAKRAEAVACEADPSKRASHGRYKKGCRCETCKRAKNDYQNAKRAKEAK